MTCQPQPQEWLRRIREVNEHFYEGGFPHCDLVLYTLNKVAKRAHLRAVLKRKEIQDVVARLKVIHPLDGGSLKWPEAMTVGTLPEALQSMCRGAYKVEFWDQNSFKMIASPEYVCLFPVNRYNERRVLRKCSDLIGMADYLMAMTMWIESMRMPGEKIICNAKAWGCQNNLTEQRVEMMSFVYDYDHVVSVTQVVR